MKPFQSNLQQDNQYRLKILSSLIIVTALLFIGYNIQGEPFFWDEAWSYLRTIDYMAKHQLTLNPVALDPEISRAHPLLFYSIMAGCYRWISSSPMVMHGIMALLNTCLLIVCTQELRKICSLKTSTLFLLFFFLQEVILVQFPMVLPEVMIGLLSALSVLYYVRHQNIALSISLMILVLIKESSIAILASIGLLLFIDCLRKQKPLQDAWVLIAPSILFLLHFVLLKQRFGWFVFPAHADVLKTGSLARTMDNLPLIFSFTCIEQGRWIMLLLLGVCIAGVLLWKEVFQIASLSKRLLVATAVFIALYTLFTAANFQMLRYQIPLIVMVCMSLAVLLPSLKIKHQLLSIAMLTGILVYHHCTERNDWIDDIRFTARNMMQVHQQCVSYLESNIPISHSIETHFLMQCNLQHEYAGYLHQKPFQDVRLFQTQPSSDYIIVSSIEMNDTYYQQLQTSKNYTLVKRFELLPAWCEIYQRKQ